MKELELQGLRACGATQWHRKCNTRWKGGCRVGNHCFATSHEVMARSHDDGGGDPEGGFPPRSPLPSAQRDGDMTGHVWNPWDTLSKAIEGPAPTDSLAPHKGPKENQRVSP